MEQDLPAAAAVKTEEATNAATMSQTQPTIPLTPQPATPQEERAVIDALEKKADDEGTKLGQTWYIVSQRWWKQWKEFTGSDYPRPRPGPINNDDIIESGDPPGEEKIKKSATEDYDFHIVSTDIWNLLQHWYGGGPPLARKVIQSGWHSSNIVVEVRPLALKVAKSSSINDFVGANFSKADTVEYFKKVMCQRMGLNPDNVRVWDYHAQNRYKLLEDEKQRLEAAQIIDGQPMLLEEKDENGKYPEPPKSRSSMYSYSSYSNSGGPVDPGTTGLMNLGNTCFMNSSLQCLTHTDPLIDYFNNDVFKGDVNADNPLGMKGEIAEAFGDLMKSLWSGSNSAVAPRELKHKIERFAPQFAGYQQHDSQELLAFLLDGLHEDLNRVKTKPYVENPEVDEKTPEAEVAKEAWKRHKSRNDSHIVDLFQGQLKSTLVCPKCQRVSVTFDPFMYLSLPLPMKTTRSIKISVFPLDPSKKPIKISCEVQKTATIKDLKVSIQGITSIKYNNLVIADVYSFRFFKFFHDKETVDLIQDRDVICAYEALPQEDAGKDFFYFPLVWRKEESLRHPYGSSSFERRSLFGIPSIVAVTDPEQLTYSKLHELVFQRIQRYLKHIPKGKIVRTTAELHGEDSESETEDESSNPSENKTGDSSGSDNENENETNGNQKKKRKVGPIFSIFVADQYGNSNPSDILDSASDKSIKFESRSSLAANWNEEIVSKLYDEEAERDFEIHPSMNVNTDSNGDEHETVTLDKCIELFTVAEQLGPEDPWYCSRCKEFQQATKKFDLWKLPPILVVHMKRFSYKNRYWREKLETFVNYPIQDLDLSSFVNGPKDIPPCYDLYAVSIHFGSLGGGHYIAYAKNRKDKQWYKYDDSSVSKISSEESVKTQSAYVLFYIRKDFAQQYSNPSSNSTQTNSNGNANTTNDSMEQEPASNSNEVKDERMEDVPI